MAYTQIYDFFNFESLGLFLHPVMIKTSTQFHIDCCKWSQRFILLFQEALVREFVQNGKLQINMSDFLFNIRLFLWVCAVMIDMASQFYVNWWHLYRWLIFPSFLGSVFEWDLWLSIIQVKITQISTRLQTLTKIGELLGLWKCSKSEGKLTNKIPQMALEPEIEIKKKTTEWASPILCREAFCCPKSSWKTPRRRWINREALGANCRAMCSGFAGVLIKTCATWRGWWWWWGRRGVIMGGGEDICTRGSVLARRMLIEATAGSWRSAPGG